MKGRKICRKPGLLTDKLVQAKLLIYAPATGLKARDVKAWGEARSAQPQVDSKKLSPAL